MKESRWDLLIRAVPHGAASESALLIALANGKLPMNEYAVVKEQAKGEVQKEHLSPIVLKPWGVSTLLYKKFF